MAKLPKIRPQIYILLMFVTIEFAWLNPLLFLGDIGEESAVLGWCLTQAGVNPPTPEEAANYSLLPAVSAAAAAPPPINKAWIN
jgi:hypothetical protein